MNYVGDHPSNLVGRVTIATSASSTPRAAICRSLLHSNAFVLGVDSSPAHSTTVASIGSHFQFLQYDAERGLNGRKAVGKVKMAYQKDEVDFMVHIGEGGKSQVGIEGLTEVVNAMKVQGEGLAESTKQAYLQLKKDFVSMS